MLKKIKPYVSCSLVDFEVINKLSNKPMKNVENMSHLINGIKIFQKVTGSTIGHGFESTFYIRFIILHSCT